MKRLWVLLTILAGSAILLAGCSLGAATPSDSGEIEIVMRDYSFSTDVIRVKAGETVTLVLTNEGDKLHEFMIGRDPFLEGNFTEGFSEDFLLAVLPEINGAGMVMGLPGGDMAGMDMENMNDNAMNMEEEAMDMENMNDNAMNMEEEAMDMGDTGTFGAFQLPLMEDHPGIMVMIDPLVVASNQETRITFTVPESMVGTWEIGCFQERGQHYDDGMRGTFIVEPAS